MGRQFTIAGQRAFALRTEELQAAFGALSRLRAMAQDPAWSQCADLVAQLAARIDPLDTTAYLLEQTGESTRNYNPAALPCEIPALEEADAATWRADAELNVILEFAPGGLLIPPEDVAAVNEAIAGVTAIEQGRCAIRTRWGLVGTVAVLGALVLGGGALIYANRKKRR